MERPAARPRAAFDTRPGPTGDDVRRFKRSLGLGLQQYCTCRGRLHPVAPPPPPSVPATWRRVSAIRSAATGGTLEVHLHRDRPGDVLVEVAEARPGNFMEGAVVVSLRELLDTLTAVAAG